MSSTYHPQTDRQSEVVNRCLEQYLRCFVHHQPHKWVRFLSWEEFWYNTTYHISVGTTPFHALYGRPPPYIPCYFVGSSLVEEVDRSLVARDHILSQFKANLATAINRMKQLADVRRRNDEFAVGDLVYLKLQPYRQHSVFRRASYNLAARYYGPYPVVKRIGSVAYLLLLPEGSRVHPVFHISVLKRQIGEAVQCTPTLPPLTDTKALDPEPENILALRWIKQNRKPTEQLLVKSWFKVAVSVTDSDGPQTYRSRCIDRISADMQNKMIKIFKNY